MSKNVVIAGTTYNNTPGVTLNVSGGGTAYFPDTSDGNVTAADVADGKICYSNGQRIVGTASGGGVVVTDTTDTHGGTIRTITAQAFNVQPLSITPSASQQVFNVGGTGEPDGYGAVTVAGDADLVGSNILSTANIFGVQGQVTFATYYTGSTAPSASLGSNGDIYLKTS